MPLINRPEYIEVNSVPLATPAWWIKDPTPLWDAPQLRGDDRIIPFAAGELPLPRVAGVIRVPLAIYVNGLYDQNGTPASNPRTQLHTNIAYLNTNVFAPNPSSPYTRSIVLHLPGGSTVSSQCIIVGPAGWQQVTNLGYQQIGVLDVKVPSGVFS